MVVKSARIQNFLGQSIPLSSDNCLDAPLAPGATCTISAPADDALAIVEVSGSPRKLRGQCQLTSALDNILGTTELR